MLLAISPLTEEHRIVARMGELMAVCDRLEAALRAKEEAAKSFAEAATSIS